ncbi:MAG TPA: tetratricopeptide repeat protein [Vicinamibacterales bacterium]|nr:tetratricopeptide repeat protein [Vicinamibacterales bacterium]
MPSLSPDRSTSPLAGQVVVFTGKLSSLGRKDARALVERLGGATADEVNARTTMLVIGAEGFGPSTDDARDKSNKLRRAEELNAQPGAVSAPIRITTEEEFCELAGVATPDALKRQYHAVRDVLARYRALREDHLRYLVKCGIVRPVLRTNADTFFTFADLGVIKQANEALAQGIAFRSAVRTLIAARQGQLEFDFRLDAAPAKIIALRHADARKPAAQAAGAIVTRENAFRAEEYFRTGSALDDGNDATRDAAATAYRRALELDPYLVAALINLANIHYSRDELVEAQALYERAIALESDFFEAHFNLGNIYHDLGRFAEAQTCYREALRLNPFYADAHFYLAVTFEKLGLSSDARPHWKAYRQLAPQGEWVELAKEFSE